MFCRMSGNEDSRTKEGMDQYDWNLFIIELLFKNSLQYFFQLNSIIKQQMLKKISRRLKMQIPILVKTELYYTYV